MESEEMEREMERMTENEKRIIEELAHLRSQNLIEQQETSDGERQDNP